MLRRAPAAVVRVNGADTRWFADDLAAAGELELDALVLPKATPEAVDALGPDGPPVIAIVETAQGLRLAYETASSPRVAALLLGAADLGAELGSEPRPDGLEVLYARSKVVADSAAAGIRAPVRHRPRRHRATARASRRPRASRARSASAARPASTRTRWRSINRVFAPEADEVAWARAGARGGYEPASAKGAARSRSTER